MARLQYMISRINRLMKDPCYIPRLDVHSTCFVEPTPSSIRIANAIQMPAANLWKIIFPKDTRPLPGDLVLVPGIGTFSVYQAEGPRSYMVAYEVRAFHVLGPNGDELFMAPNATITISRQIGTRIDLIIEDLRVTILQPEAYTVAPLGEPITSRCIIPTRYDVRDNDGVYVSQMDNVVTPLRQNKYVVSKSFPVPGSTAFIQAEFDSLVQ